MKVSSKLFAGLFVAAGLLTTTSQAVAQDQVDVKVTAPNYPNGAPIPWNGVYVSPYTGVLTATNQTIVLNCVDFFHSAYLNTPWTANRTWLNADLGLTRFGNSNVQAYLQAAWLTTMYPPGLGDDPYSDDEKFRTIAIQSAIWNIFASASPDRVYGSDPDNNAYDSEWWLDQLPVGAALDAWAAENAHKFYVLTPTNAFNQDGTDNKNSFQEFLVYNATAVPEPATLVLLSTGAFSVFAARRRRKNRGA